MYDDIDMQSEMETIGNFMACADLARGRGATDQQILDDLTPRDGVYRTALRRYLATGQRSLD